MESVGTLLISFSALCSGGGGAVKVNASEIGYIAEYTGEF